MSIIEDMPSRCIALSHALEAVRLSFLCAAHIPPEILERKAVATTVRFRSKEVITKFRMVQKMMLGDRCVEGKPYR